MRLHFFLTGPYAEGVSRQRRVRLGGRGFIPILPMARGYHCLLFCYGEFERFCEKNLPFFVRVCVKCDFYCDFSMVLQVPLHCL